MRLVQERLDATLQESTLRVQEVFSPSMMHELLVPSITDAEKTIMDYVYERIRFNTLHDLITNPEIGHKRFVSMADRVLRDHPLYGIRPSLITGYDGDISSIATWWPKYVQFMREVRPLEVLREHDMIKYGNSGLSAFELEQYKLFQFVYLAAADAAFIRIAETAPELNGSIREYNKACKDKFNRITRIIKSKTPDVAFLQEVDRQAFPVPDGYGIFTPEKSNGKQDSLILLREGVFELPKTVKVDDSIVSSGDIVLLRTVHTKTHRSLLLGSYHGDANGKKTIPVLTNIALQQTLNEPMIVGSDTNAHASSSKGDKLSFSELKTYTKESGWILSNPEGRATTQSCRTFFQAQSHKGHHASDIEYQSDPKDQILIRGTSKINSAGIDFTGQDNESVVVEPIPSLGFPSDHALVWAEIDISIAAHDDEL